MRRIRPLILLVLGCLPPAAPAAADIGKADRILVVKSEHRLYLLAGGRPVKTYPVSLGRNPEGPKQAEGDRRTPEGTYFISRRNARSSFYKALQISYPNAEDRARAARLGVSPGGLIMLHGQPNTPAGRLAAKALGPDWTAGCIALSDRDIDEIWQAVADGTPIEIRP